MEELRASTCVKSTGSTGSSSLFQDAATSVLVSSCANREEEPVLPRIPVYRRGAPFQFTLSQYIPGVLDCSEINAATGMFFGGTPEKYGAIDPKWRNTRCAPERTMPTALGSTGCLSASGIIRYIVDCELPHALERKPQSDSL